MAILRRLLGTTILRQPPALCPASHGKEWSRCPRRALPSHSHHHFVSVPLHQNLPFLSCRG